MTKLKVLVAFTAIALVVPLAVSGQKGKPPAYATVTITDNINSGASTVQVGRSVQTYGPTSQELYIHELLLPPEGAADLAGGIALVKGAPLVDDYYGPYYGQIRVLNDRIDYWFDTAPGCAEAITSTYPCRFRAVVVDGSAVYSGTGKKSTLTRIAFNDGRYLLDYRWCDPATNPDCYVKLYGCYDDRDCPGVPPGGEGYVYATLNVWF